ncbi:MAG: VWA domain-containing protein [Phycisphaerales bacterium]|nr:VWA domain-containing protein [Phycisphaerales bacterium]
MSALPLMAVAWLAPLAATVVALATIPPLVALYFLRLRRTKRVISSTLLWTRATQDLRANAPFQRLRFSLLLLLQLLALLLVIIAIAQPQLDLGETHAARVVLLVDASGSMGATDCADGSTRLSVAKRLATERVQSLHSGGLFSGVAPAVMVIAFAKDAQVACPFTDNAAQAIDAIAAIQATDETTALVDAFELARAFTTVTDPDNAQPIAAEPPAYELFSDGRVGDLARVVLRTGERVIFHTIGSATTQNVGIAGLAAARNPDRPDEVQIFARVVNWNTTQYAGDLEVRVDGQLRAVTPKPVEVPAAQEDAKSGVRLAGETQVVFPSIQLPQGGVVEVGVTTKDALITDDRASVVAAPPHALHIAVVGRGTFVLKSLLEGMSLAALDLFTVDEWDRRVASDAQAPDSYDVIVLDDVMPASLERGRYLIFRAPPVAAGVAAYGEKSNASVRSLRDEHPLLQYVNLDDLFVSSMTAVAPGGDADVIVEASDGPLVLTVNRGALTLVYVTFDPMDSNWPFQRGFVNFCSNAIAWLAAGGNAVTDEPLAPGDVITTRLPKDARSPMIRTPDGEEIAIFGPPQSSLSYGPVRRSGVYRLQWKQSAEDRPARLLAYAVNMKTRIEGRCDAASDISFATERVAGVQGGGVAKSAAWPWLLLAAFALLIVEWWVWLRLV